MTTAPNLAQRLLAVSKDLGWVEKKGSNKQQNYDYVRAVDVFDSARDVLHKHGVLWSWSTTSYDIFEVAGKVWHKMSADYTFINADVPEDRIISTVHGSAQPPGDKGAWVVTTGMLKYALIQAFLLPTGDDPEEDANEPRAERPKSPTPAPVQQKATVPQVAEKGTDAEHLTDKQIALLKVTLRDAGLSVTDSQRYVLNKLVGKHSSKQMTSTDLDTVLAFFKPKTDATEALVVEAMASATGGK